MSHSWRTTIALMACASGLAFASAVFAPVVQGAQPNTVLGHPGAPDRAGDLLATLTRLLELTPEQQTQAKSIMEDIHSQMKTMMADQSLSPEERQQRKQQFHEDAMEKMNAILTPEQQETFEKFQKEHPFDHAMSGHGPHETHDMMGELSEALKLTPDQQMQMKKIFAEFHPQAESIQSNPSISQGDKMARLDEIHQRMRDRLRTILTPDQQTTFDQMHP